MVIKRASESVSKSAPTRSIGTIKTQVLGHIGKKVNITTPEGNFEGVWVKDILFNRNAPFIITFESEEGKTGFVYGGEGVSVKEVE